MGPDHVFAPHTLGEEHHGNRLNTQKLSKQRCGGSRRSDGGAGHLLRRTTTRTRRIQAQGKCPPYQESASSGATTTQFKKAVLSLKVTPQITPDDRVILDRTVSKDNVGELVSSATGGAVPSIDTREIITQVLVNDGQTVVLGGIMETERRDTVNKVPYLGDIPGLGVLFRSKSKTDNKDELLIFVTPKILREGADVY